MTRFIVCILFVAGCSGSTKPATLAEPAKPKPTEAEPKGHTEHKDEPEQHEELPSVVSLSADVIRDAGIKTKPAELKALPETISLTGELVTDPDRTAKITVRVAGRLTAVRVKEGDRVKAGQLIASVESPELAKARAAFISAQARARSARQNAGRLGNVAKQGLASGQEVDTADAEAAALDADTRAARQTLLAFGPAASQDVGDSARLDLYAPIDGVVLSREGVRGQTIPAEFVVATVADLEKLFFVARLFEKDLARVRVGAAVEVRLNAYPTELFEGTVEMIGNQLDATARTVTARIVLKNRGSLLKVGLFGNASVVVSDVAPRTARVVVPQSAVTKIADKNVVFVRQPDDHFEVHPVTLGRSAAGSVEILTGLTAKEQVVTEGVFTLKSAVLKSTFGEED